MNRGMKKHVCKAAACFATGAMLVAGSQIAAMATGTSIVGVEAVEEKAEVVEEKNDTEESSEETAETVEEVTEEAAPSMVGTLGIAVLGEGDYFFIRQAASTSSDVIGYMYDGSCAVIIGEEGDWYQVQSGNCMGYVAKHLLTTGDDAQKAIDMVSTPIAQVNASGLMVRTGANEDAEVIDMITEDTVVYVEEELDGWTKISVDGQEGYVNSDYVSYGSLLPQAESHVEASERIAEEEAAYAAWVAEQEAAYAAWVAEQEALYLEAIAAEQAEWEAQNQAWIEYLQSQGAYADQAQVAADEAAANQEWAEQMYQDAEQALYDAYEYGDEEAIAEAEAAYQDAGQVYEDATVAADAAQSEADAADQTFNSMVADAGIDTTEIEAEGTTDGTSSQRQAIVDYALQFVGNPYVYGGTSLTNGTDCSGFTQGVLGNFGININRTAGQQSLGGKNVDLSDIQPGDLLFYSGDGDHGIGHVSMYIGNGQVVHASSSTTGIIVSDINYRTPTSASNYID